MYQEGQILKLTATATNPLRTIYDAPITVTVLAEDNLLYVQLSADDAAKHPRGRDQISFSITSAAPDWTIEIVEAPAAPVAPAVETPAAQPAPYTREEWNSVYAIYGANMPEDSYEEYLAHQQAAQPTYTVQLPDDAWGVITAAEAAQRYGLAEATVRQAINRGQLPARKSAGTWLVRVRDAQARWGSSRAKDRTMKLNNWQDENRFSEGRTPFYVPKATQRIIAATTDAYVSEYQQRAATVKALALQLLDAWGAWDAIPVVENRPELHPQDQAMCAALAELDKALEWAGFDNRAADKLYRKAHATDIYFTLGIENARKLLTDAEEYHTRRDWTERSDAWHNVYSNS